ncbi:Ribbon-helix-helix protein, copG family [Candidatus Methylomirabilis lanthanidiphila]|uniref:Ribbon-helix-helix protein, copG family n=1 Tax=Candidatus Methylomirabilis lanthanidiphila TaxID=2211376 RepID=A0A564ZLM8_9BACT|nr:ribbon-helix-helix domain-containing protein [Candidatus Methylomirabilis lanthanidiphila]VUZ86241.1 Ribbon-helix-helix protein, copG family [Candidatus Methylomirabilis lanthanidiphila]
MRTIQMTLDDDLVKSVDRIAKELKTTRSAFARKALRDAIHQMQVRRLEERHRKGYQSKPVKKGEFDVWEAAQAWGDE